MKRIQHYILLSVLAFAATGCVEKEFNDNRLSAESGDEVVFGLSLEKGLDTKTVYGTETSTGFPIYWVHGDKVLIASPQCMDGRNSAEYEVSTVSADGSTIVTNQNFATSLTKTGDAGVQWGNTTLADFYSIYPSSGSTLEVKEDGTGVVATLGVASTQYASFTTVDNIVYAQPKDMGNVIMYAFTEDASPTDADGNPQTVKLKYKPFSTVIEFETTPTTTGSGGANPQETIIIQSLTLTAPSGTNIAGNFTFNFPDKADGTPSVTNVTSGSNAITLHFLENNQYTTTLTTAQTLKAKMCLMPINTVTSLDGWVITVATSAGNFKKTISGTSNTTALTAGKVHKIKLPSVIMGTDEWKYSLPNWITSLPDYKNIYLTEISLPGAWYAGNGTKDGYQATDDIATLWNNGVRAFAVETRTGTEIGATAASSVYVSGTGSEQASAVNSYNSLHADTANSAKGYRSGTEISTLIKTIAEAVQDDEFGVLILSYADGGNGGHRYVDYGAWLQLLSSTINNLSTDVKDKIHQSEITKNTIVDDVLGKLIIKINVDANIAQSGSVITYSEWFTQKTSEFKYENNLPALFSYNPFALQLNDFQNPYYSQLYWQTWKDSYRSCSTSSSSSFLWCFSSANRTQLDTGTDTTIPTYQNRKNALDAMMAKSKAIYDASTHNIWFYFNCGGTQATSSTDENASPTEFATTMNAWLLTEIQAKYDRNEPSPLGIVMFNQCTNETYNGPAIVKGIVEMNNKFYLKHFGDEVTTPASEVKSLSENYSAAVVDTGADAINWE